jgi:hypothetical protein
MPRYRPRWWFRRHGPIVNADYMIAASIARDLTENPPGAGRYRRSPDGGWH